MYNSYLAPKQSCSISQERFVYDGKKVDPLFDKVREREKFTQTNFKVGRLRPGLISCYNKQFIDYSNPRIVHVNKEDKCRLEASHWDHSRSWSQNFKTENKQRFLGKFNDSSFTENKHFGY